jgi:chloramphenicol 3-O-phosphotransferase
MSRRGLVLVLDGPTGVGRTTTLRGLQSAWPARRGGPLLEAGLDAARAALGPGTAGRLGPLIDRIERGRAGSPPRHHLGPLGRELVAGMHRAAVAWAASGVDVALDHLLVDAALVADLRAAVGDLPLLVVAMTCDPVVLEDREERTPGAARGRAAAETAALSAARDGAGAVAHDLVLDTTAATTDELVAEVLDLVDRRLGRLSRT